MTERDLPERRFTAGKWLAASLAGNLFLAGIVIGAFLTRPGGPPGPPPRPPLQMMVQEAAGKLSPEGLKKLEALADELESNFRREMRGADRQRINVREALLREPFDAKAFAAALDDMHASFSQGRAKANQRFAEVIATLSPADRRQLTAVHFR